MPAYQTKQRSQLLDFLRRHPDESFTAEELSMALNAALGAEQAPGKSTVYRLISRLEAEGEVMRFEQEGGRSTCYQLTGCGSNCAHLHMKCTDCGRLFHMKDAASEQLLQEILDRDHFAVNGHQTVLYGHCDRCRKN